MERTYTTAEVVALTGIPQSSLWRMAHSGVVTALNPGRRGRGNVTLYDSEALATLMELRKSLRRYRVLRQQGTNGGV